MISIIIPTYNRASTIKRSVRSVLSQTIKDIECIVVDDCSNDNTYDIIKSITDERLRYYCLGKNSGACVARNYGIKVSKGDYIAFQDSDDEWEDNKLEIQMKALISSKADVCFSKTSKYDVNGNILKYEYWNLNEGILDYQLLYEHSRVTTQTILCYRYVVEEFQFDQNVKKMQDYEWTIRSAQKYKFYFVAQPLVKQYIQNDSITEYAEKNYKIGKTTYEYFYQKFQNLFVDEPKLEATLLKGIAQYKLLLKENARNEYKKINQIERTRKTHIMYYLSWFAPVFLRNWYKYRRKKF